MTASSSSPVASSSSPAASSSSTAVIVDSCAMTASPSSPAAIADSGDINGTPSSPAVIADSCAMTASPSSPAESPFSPAAIADSGDMNGTPSSPATIADSCAMTASPSFPAVIVDSRAMTASPSSPAAIADSGDTNGTPSSLATIADSCAMTASPSSPAATSASPAVIVDSCAMTASPSSPAAIADSGDINGTPSSPATIVYSGAMTASPYPAAITDSGDMNGIPSSPATIADSRAPTQFATSPAAIADSGDMTVSSSPPAGITDSDAMTRTVYSLAPIGDSSAMTRGIVDCGAEDRLVLSMYNFNEGHMERLRQKCIAEGDLDDATYPYTSWETQTTSLMDAEDMFALGDYGPYLRFVDVICRRESPDYFLERSMMYMCAARSTEDIDEKVRLFNVAVHSARRAFCCCFEEDVLVHLHYGLLLYEGNRISGDSSVYSYISRRCQIPPWPRANYCIDVETASGLCCEGLFDDKLRQLTTYEGRCKYCRHMLQFLLDNVESCTNYRLINALPSSEVKLSVERQQLEGIWKGEVLSYVNSLSLEDWEALMTVRAPDLLEAGKVINLDVALSMLESGASLELFPCCFCKGLVFSNSQKLEIHILDVHIGDLQRMSEDLPEKVNEDMIRGYIVPGWSPLDDPLVQTSPSIDRRTELLSKIRRVLKILINHNILTRSQLGCCRDLLQGTTRGLPLGAMSIHSLSISQLKLIFLFFNNICNSCHFIYPERELPLETRFVPNSCELPIFLDIPNFVNSVGINDIHKTDRSILVDWLYADSFDKDYYWKNWNAMLSGSRHLIEKLQVEFSFLRELCNEQLRFSNCLKGIHRGIFNNENVQQFLTEPPCLDNGELDAIRAISDSFLEETALWWRRIALFIQICMIEGRIMWSLRSIEKLKESLSVATVYDFRVPLIQLAKSSVQSRLEDQIKKGAQEKSGAAPREHLSEKLECLEIHGEADHQKLKLLAEGAVDDASLGETMSTYDLDLDSIGASSLPEVREYCILNVILESFRQIKWFQYDFLMTPEHEHGAAIHCVVCELRNIFTAMNELPDEAQTKSVDPTKLCDALKKTYPDSSLFQQGQMNNASMVLLAILNCIHQSASFQDCDANFFDERVSFTWNNGSNSLSHFPFGMNIYEQCCDCGVESLQKIEMQFFHHINTTTLQKLNTSVTPVPRVLCDSDRGCGSLTSNFQFFSSPPHFFMIGLDWGSAYSINPDLLATEINLGVLSSGAGIGCRGRLVSVISRCDHHYICCARKTEHEKWIKHHGPSFEDIGDWNDVCRLFVRFRARPEILFYEVSNL